MDSLHVEIEVGANEVITTIEVGCATVKSIATEVVLKQSKKVHLKELKLYR